MDPMSIDCGLAPRTWEPVRHGEMAYLEDADAAGRIWLDRRKDILQLLRSKFGGGIDSARLVLIMSEVEHVTCMNNAEFVDYLELNGVTPQEMV